MLTCTLWFSLGSLSLVKQQPRRKKQKGKNESRQNVEAQTQSGKQCTCEGKLKG